MSDTDHKAAFVRLLMDAAEIGWCCGIDKYGITKHEADIKELASSPAAAAILGEDNDRKIVSDLCDAADDVIAYFTGKFKSVDAGPMVIDGLREARKAFDVAAPFVPRFQCPECDGWHHISGSSLPDFDAEIVCVSSVACMWSGPRTACGLAPPVTTEPPREAPTNDAVREMRSRLLTACQKQRQHPDMHVPVDSDELLAVLLHHVQLDNDVHRLQSAAAERERQVTALVAAAQPFAKYMAAIEGWPATGEETLQPRSDTGYVPLKLFIRIKHLREIREALAALTPNATEAQK